MPRMRRVGRESKPWFPIVGQNFLLEVTAEMIAQAGSDGASCIGRALTRRFQLDGTHVQVFSSFGSVSKSLHSKGVIISFSHSQEAKEFLQKIRDGESVRLCRLRFTRIG